VAGAEKLRDSVAKAFKEKFDKDLLEGYGTTEMSPVVSVNVPDIEHENQRQTGFKPGTVGHPIPGVSAKVVDVDTGADLGPGREGMLLVKGPNLMLGYLNQPAKTKEAVKDGWYVTGDLASIGEDGFIRIADRVSRFSKIGGEMVPHIKIEDMIAANLGCDSAVTSVPDEQKGERLVVFYTKKELSPQDVREALMNTSLPKLWLPKKENIFYVEAIPLTATGKADLRKIKGMAKGLAGA